MGSNSNDFNSDFTDCIFQKKASQSMILKLNIGLQNIP